jgi:hypothetical protein
MYRILVLLIFTSIFFWQSSLASEITSKNSQDPHFIQVLTTSVNGELELGFRYCDSNPSEQSECQETIGEKSFYPVTDLLRARRRQEWEMVGAALLDPVLIAGTIAGGAAAGGAIGAAVMAGSPDFGGLAGLVDGAVIGGAVGGGAGGILVKVAHALDPFYHAREMKLVGKALLTGEDIQVMSVDDYAKELTAILHGIR